MDFELVCLDIQGNFSLNGFVLFIDVRSRVTGVKRSIVVFGLIDNERPSRSFVVCALWRVELISIGSDPRGVENRELSLFCWGNGFWSSKDVTEGLARSRLRRIKFRSASRSSFSKRCSSCLNRNTFCIETYRSIKCRMRKD